MGTSPPETKTLVGGMFCWIFEDTRVWEKRCKMP